LPVGGLARTRRSGGERASDEPPDDDRAQDARSAHVVVILGGSDAGERAKTMNLPVPIVSDADGQLASELDVHGWPTAIVISTDGTEIARVGGTANSLAMKLAAYVELASGKSISQRQSDAPRRATSSAIAPSS
jgi:hypothetical protein